MRTYLRSKFTLLFMMLGLLVAVPTIALADTLFISNDLTIGGNATKAPGDTGTANVWLEPTNGTPTGDTNGCNASTNVGQEVEVTLSSNNASVTFPNGASVKLTDCGTANAKQISYAVASNALAGTAVISGTATGGKDTGTRTYNTTDTLTVTITPPANTAPTVPGIPSGASPNQGTFTLDWDDSTDAQSNPITYTLQHKDSNDANFSNVATSISGSSYSFTATSPEAEGTWTYQVKASDGSLESAFSAASNAIKVDKSAPSQPNANFNKPAEDTVGGWYKDSVTVSYNGSTDPALLDTSDGSGVASYTADQPFSSPSGTYNFSGKATDGAGNESAARTGQVKVDATNPVVTITGCPTTDVIKGSSQSIAVSASDAHSGLATDPSDATVELNTGTTGQKTASFKAVDRVGHEKTESCTYNVIFDFSGFFRPVDNPDVVNSAKAGSTIPVKFSLGGDQGLNIFWTLTPNVSYPNSGKLTIDQVTGDPIDALEEYSTATVSGLKYDATANQYIYNWKTDKNWAGTYRQLIIRLEDGTYHRANFYFTK
jgi:hypothetical protein